MLKIRSRIINFLFLLIMVRASSRSNKKKTVKATKKKTVKSKTASKSQTATKSQTASKSTKSNLGPRRQSYFHSQEFVYTSHPAKGEPYGKITTLNMNNNKGEKTMLMLNKTGKPIKSSLKKSSVTRPPGLVEAFVF